MGRGAGRSRTGRPALMATWRFSHNEKHVTLRHPPPLDAREQQGNATWFLNVRKMAYRRLGLTGTGEDDVQSAAERVEERQAPAVEGCQALATTDVLSVDIMRPNGCHTSTPSAGTTLGNVIRLAALN